MIVYTGSPYTVDVKRPVGERFWEKVDKSGGETACWPWQASRHPFGYGWFHLNGQAVTAHRLALMLTEGPPPIGFHALHRCDNPPCCNPAHLYWGTDRDNHADRVRAGHASPPPRNDINPPIRYGVTNNRAKLTPERVALIRSLRLQGLTYSAIAVEVGISKPTVAQVLTGKTWKEVPA